jgi:hypothetical protein
MKIMKSFKQSSFKVSRDEYQEFVKGLEDYNKRHKDNPITFEEYLKNRVFHGLGKKIEELKREGKEVGPLDK